MNFEDIIEKERVNLIADSLKDDVIKTAMLRRITAQNIIDSCNNL